MLFLCYYVLSPSNSSGALATQLPVVIIIIFIAVVLNRFYDFGSCHSHTASFLPGEYLNLTAFFVEWNFTTTFVLVYAVFYFVLLFRFTENFSSYKKEIRLGSRET